ncbi:hypothetical protein [Pseudogemmobacter bohemicus]|uniref:hypothetical protein n=1 Tax=Pseudogemmobacter bohemicus TaxID=2250708 RepID=UPI000DD33819|nr:hypothetical protein [Pseudogemmobacter bohemicus]
MRRRFPRSLLFFLPSLFAAVNGTSLPYYALHLPVPPLLAVFLAWLLAVAIFACLWLGMIGIMVEVAGGKIHALWLTPVIAVFSGYYLLYAVENLRYAQELRERAVANAGLRVEFDPTRQALVLPLFPAGSLLLDYGVPVTYTFNPLDPSSPTRAGRFIDGTLCDELLERLPNGWIPGIDFGGAYHPGRQEICLLTMPEVPDLPAIRIQAPPEGSPGRGASLADRGYLIEPPGGAAPVMLRDPAPGWLPLPWWPDLGAFCGRLLGRKAMTIGCMRLDTRMEWATAPNSLEALARVLGLEKVGPEGRIMADPDLVRRKFDAALAGLVAEQIRLADLWIAGRQQDHGLDHRQMPRPLAEHLALDPAALSGRAEQIMAALEDEAATAAPDQSRVANLYILLSALDEAEVMPLLPRLKQLETLYSWQSGDELLRRLRAFEARRSEPARD